MPPFDAIWKSERHQAECLAESAHERRGRQASLTSGKPDAHRRADWGAALVVEALMAAPFLAMLRQ